MQAKQIHEGGAQRTFALVFDAGDEVVSGLTEFAGENDLDAASSPLTNDSLRMPGIVYRETSAPRRRTGTSLFWVIVSTLAFLNAAATHPRGRGTLRAVTGIGTGKERDLAPMRSSPP